jgi:hypothetical protein
VGAPPQEIHLDLHFFLSKYQHVFETPRGLPPSRGEHDYGILLTLGSLLPNMCPYRHHFAQKNKIEKIIQEFLEVGFICLSTIPYSSSVVMVLKKEGNWVMCPNFWALNKLTIKDKFTIPVSDISWMKFNESIFSLNLTFASDITK